MMDTILKNLSEDQFSNYKNMYLDEMNKIDLNMNDRSDRIYREISTFQENFLLKSEIILKIPLIKLKEIIDFYNEIFIIKPKKLSIQVINN